MSHRHLAVLACAFGAFVSTQALANLPCTIKPPPGASDAELSKLATLSKADAAKIVLAKVKSAATATISSAELEAEHGCLIWSFDVRIDGKSGIQEVTVDAGDGRVITSTHEGPHKEAAEKAAEARESRGKPKP